MIDHAKKGFPNEACGILGSPPKADESPPQSAGGSVRTGDLRTDPTRRLADADVLVADAFFPMKNLDESSISYFMDPKEQLEVFKKMREKNLEMTGIFHSHVASEAAPSQKDVRLAFYPEVSYLIASLSNMEKPTLRSFKIKEEKVTEEEIRIV